jgi:hypothetical protein
MVQRANIKSCFKLVKTAKEKQEMLGVVNGNEAVSRTHVSEWRKELGDEREKLEDYPSSGRSSHFLNAETAVRIQ